MVSSVAYFISSHGFGHASRACAVMAALQQKQPQLSFHIFTQTPLWFFEEAVPGLFTYHKLLSDVGVVQESPMQEDLPETLRRLGAFIPFSEEQLGILGRTLRTLECDCVICDISPLGIAAGKKAGLPVILIENFTWDWIYETYLPRFPQFAPFIAFYHDIFRRADYLFQTEPVCLPDEQAVTFSVPVSRRPRIPARLIRQRLEIPPNVQTILVSMGGIPQQFDFLERLDVFGDVRFIIPGSVAAMELRGNKVLLPHHSDFYHPDLVAASDAVIGKAGYSTIAEAYHAGIPFGYVNRVGFREAEVLELYIRNELHGMEIPIDDFVEGRWDRCLSNLLAQPRILHEGPNGAELIAEHLLSLNLGYN